MMLIPVEELTAEYDPLTFKLKLTARGKVAYQTIAIHFKKNQLSTNGLQFSLRGYPQGGSPFYQEIVKDYSHDEFFITLGSPGSGPPLEVIILTSNYPNGHVVPVRNLGARDPDVSENTESLISINAVGPLRAPRAVEREVELDTRVGGRFTLREILPSESGSVDIDFDPYRLKLEHASISQGSMNWKFTAMEEGNSIIIVDRIPSMETAANTSPIHFRTLYVISVAYAEQFSTKAFGSEGQFNGLSAASTAPMTSGDAAAIHGITFIGRVKKALDIVKKERPEAETVKVHATPMVFAPPPEDDPLVLSQLECTFKVDGGTATMQSIGLDRWEDPEITKNANPPSTKPFDINKVVDIVPAVQAMVDKKVHIDLKRSELYEPFEEVRIPDQQQPYYHFQMEGDAVVLVGAIDKGVVVPSEGANGDLAGM